MGTATTLLTYGGVTVLIDRNFLHRGQRANLGKGLWSRRLTEPAPVLSHLHGDHFDRVARRALDRSLPIITTRPAARTLRRRGFPHAVALSRFESHELVKDGTTCGSRRCRGGTARCHGPAAGGHGERAGLLL